MFITRHWDTIYLMALITLVMTIVDDFLIPEIKRFKEERKGRRSKNE